MKLSKKFNKFIGKKIETHETAMSFYSPTYKRTMTRKNYAVSGNCKTIRKVFDLANKEGLYLRFWGVSHFGGPKGTEENRVNVFFKKEGDNRFTISNITRG